MVGLGDGRPLRSRAELTGPIRQADHDHGRARGARGARPSPRTASVTEHSQERTRDARFTLRAPIGTGEAPRPDAFEAATPWTATMAECHTKLARGAWAPCRRAMRARQRNAGRSRPRRRSTTSYTPSATSTRRRGGCSSSIGSGRGGSPTELDADCATGDQAGAPARRGRSEVWGLDLDRALVSRVRRKHLRVHFHDGARHIVEVHDRTGTGSTRQGKNPPTGANDSRRKNHGEPPNTTKSLRPKTLGPAELARMR